MIISQAPFRMSFFGGGTDMPEYFRENGGAVLSTSIDKYCYIYARKLPEFFDYRSEMVYSRIERVNTVDEIEHPAIRNAMKMLGMDHIRLTYEADLPARSGLGTSSSFAVAMLNAFHQLRGDGPQTKRSLADEAIYLERVLCAEAGGWQDQIAAAFGGFNRISFHGDQYEVTPIACSDTRKASLNDHLMMFFTGFTRNSFDVHKDNKTSGAQKFAIYREMYQLLQEAEKCLTDEQTSIDEFGRLLHITWQLKRQTGAKISTSGIDTLYDIGLAHGALGGKLLGAGGGGFLVFYVPPERQQELREALSDLLYIPFKFENNGAQLIRV